MDHANIINLHYRSTGFCLCVAQKPVLLKRAPDTWQVAATVVLASRLTDRYLRRPLRGRGRRRDTGLARQNGRSHSRHQTTLTVHNFGLLIMLQISDKFY